MNTAYRLNDNLILPERTDYNIGIIGSGFIVRECHMPAYREAGFHVRGIASRTRANAEAVAVEFEIPVVYDSVDALLTDPDIDVVDIAVPPHKQPDLIIKAAKAGKHILAQKPLAVSYDEAQRVVKICESCGVKLAVNQNGRFDPAIQAANTLLKSGILGRPVFSTIELRFRPHWQPYQEQYDRLMYLFMSIHHLDQFRFLFGLPESIYASSVRHPEGVYNGEYVTAYILNYANGLMASAWDDGYTWDPSSFGVNYRIEGTEGVAKMNIGWPSGGPSTISYYSKQLGDEWFQPKLQGNWFPGAFKYTMGELFRMVAEDSDSPISGRSNLSTMAMVEACYRSESEKRAIRLDEIINTELQ